MCRGVVQGDIFSPVAFIAGNWRIFTTHDCPDAGVTIGSPLKDVKIRALEYTDDACLLDNNTSESSTRLTSIARGSCEEASIVISEKKTKAKHVQRMVQRMVCQLQQRKTNFQTVSDHFQERNADSPQSLVAKKRSSPAKAPWRTKRHCMQKERRQRKTGNMKH